MKIYAIVTIGLLGAVCSASVVKAQSSTSNSKRPNPPPQVCIDANCVTASRTGSGHIKWNPGHYIARDVHQLQRDLANLSQTFAYMDTWASHPGVKGFQFFVRWSELENPNVPGDYSGGWTADYAGFRLWDALIARAASYNPPRQVSFHLDSYGDGSTAGGQSYAFPRGHYPAYLNSSTYVTTGAAQNASTGVLGGAWVNSSPSSGSRVSDYPRFWDPAVMTRLIAMSSAYGARYDKNPRVEMISWLDESVVDSPDYPTDDAVPVMTGPNGYFAKVRAGWPTTQLRYWLNYANHQPNVPTLLDSAIASFFVIGGPDLANESGTSARVISGNLAYRGVNPDFTVNSGRPDYRGRAAFAGEVEGDSYVLRNLVGTTYPLPVSTDYTAQFGTGVFATSMLREINLYQGSYVFWYQNTQGYAGGYPFMQMDTASPNLLDYIDYSEGFHTAGNASLNTALAPAILNKTYPPLWP
jgi:hypothetical protein